jgi:hypothetical protein
VIGARHYDEVIPGDHFDGEARIPEFFFGTLDKAEFDVAADYGSDDLGRVADRNDQRHAGIGLVEIDQSRWQEMTGYRLARLDRETPASKARELAHRKFHRLGAIDQVARFVKQQLASFGYDDASPNPMKQFCAELPLEGRHCRRYRGRGKSEGGGRTRYVFAFGNRDEDLQLVECHPAVLGQCGALDLNYLTIARTPASGIKAFGSFVPN